MPGYNGSSATAAGSQRQYMTDMNNGEGLLGNGNMGSAESTMERLLTNHQVERKIHFKFNMVIMLMILIIALQAGLLMRLK